VNIFGKNHLWLTTFYVVLALCSWGVCSQQLSSDFGPARYPGAFYSLENDHQATLYARAVRRDRAERIWLLQDWATVGNLDTDCAIQRHIKNGLLLDMDFGGSREATKRVFFDLGGDNADVCFDMEFSPGGKAVVVATSSTASGSTGSFARLMPDGSLDSTFGGDGRVDLQTLGVPAFDGINLRDVVVLSDSRVAACGFINVAGNLNMFAVMLTASGALDSSFAFTGYRQIAFDSGGDNADTCLTMERLTDGNLLLVGRSKVSNNATDNDFAAAKLTVNGLFVSSFGASGKSTYAIDAASSFADDRAYDVAVDPQSGNAYLFGESVSTVATTPSMGAVLAINNLGQRINTFGSNGLRAFRYADRSAIRGVGGSAVRRGIYNDGRLYVVGHHFNTAAFQTNFGAVDVAIAVLNSDDGTFVSGYGNNGVSYHSFNMVQYSDIENAAGGAANRNKIDEYVGDVDLSDNRMTMALFANRFPAIAGITLNDGAFAPALAQLTIGLQQDGFERDSFKGIAPPDINLAPPIGVPTGYARYCSVRDAGSGAAGLATGSASEDPCQTFLSSNPNLIIERAGLWYPNGQNQAMHVCGNNVVVSRGNGGTPINDVFNSAPANSGCVFTIAPQYLPIFERPYSGAHISSNSIAYFAHTAYLFGTDPAAPGISVTPFGQTPVVGHSSAHAVDFFGRQQCGVDGSNNHTLAVDIDEPAIDISLPQGRGVEAMAAGIVLQAVPRYVINAAPTSGDPYQREFFIGHRVGFGRYQEEFVSYYAHTSNTLVRIGDIVNADTVLGNVGTTGASGGYHLHFGVMRYKNLSFRANYRFNFDYGNFGDSASRSAAVDPYGWKAPLISGNDPWAYLFKNSNGGNSGAFSSDLWISDAERPPTN
jgi:uncharacterized delta-60 repeat protein